MFDILAALAISATLVSSVFFCEKVIDFQLHK